MKSALWAADLSAQPPAKAWGARLSSLTITRRAPRPRPTTSATLCPLRIPLN
jgi:hypothetical protein